MKEEDFLRVKQELDHFQYNSMIYVDYEEISGYEILYENENLILIYGYNVESKKNQYYWACNTAEDLINGIDSRKQNVLLNFIPDVWVDNLRKAGFEVYAVWNDYWRPDLNNIQHSEEPEFLTEDECEAASEVTLSCQYQSRGFSGQTTEWFRQWIRSDGPAANVDTKNCAVLVHKFNGKIVGIVCTGTYSHDSSKGPIVWIRAAAVRPEYQRKGIARKLISQALFYGKKLGAARAFLAADECNVHAIHMYESLGFCAKKDEAEIVMAR